MVRLPPLLLALVLALLAAAGPVRAEAPIPIKVVILTTFEVGEDTGDTPGEFQAWVERWPLPHTLTVPGVARPVRYSDDGVLGVVTGMRGRARESVAALALSDRFDLSHAYWLVAGIAGVDPRAGSIGSAAWIDWVVDADPLFELDDRELPAGWPEGLYAQGARRPGEKGSGRGSSEMAWRLNSGLAAWALDLSRDAALPDADALRADRAGFAEEPAALKPPGVFMGAALGTVRFWHGARRTQWARDWVALQTDGKGVFAMTDCEDQGVLDVLSLYARLGRVDFERVMILRAASNYSREPLGSDQAVRFADGGAEAGFEAAWRAGSPVVRALVAGWPRYAAVPPAAPVEVR